MEYPKKRNLDGVYFRIKRDKKFDNICFSDLMESEQDDVMEDRSEEWLKKMCKVLSNSIRLIADYFNIYNDISGDEE
jgi:hypothetical protein